jgi:hydrogenase maturation protease
LGYKTLITQMKTLVIGLGNPILTDDGVGVKVAYAVEKALIPGKSGDITVTEASVGGLRLMEEMVGYNRAILIDALMKSDGGTPGTIHRMTLDDLQELSPTQHSACAHDTTLVTALEAGKLIGLHLPEDIVIFAIEVEIVSEFNDEPTPAVAEAIPRATAAVLNELNLPVKTVIPVP